MPKKILKISIPKNWIEAFKKNNLDTNLDLPNLETEWESDSLVLTPTKPVSLTWTNNQDITFKVNYAIDDEYMFSITQEVINNSNNSIQPNSNSNQPNF